MRKLLTLLNLFLLSYLSYAQPVSNGLVSSYFFNSNTNDTSSNNFDLTNNGGVYTTDRFKQNNSAILLDGSDHLVLNDANNLCSDSFSISLWVRIDQLPSAGTIGSIICLGNTSMDHGLNVANNYLGVYDGFTSYSYNTPVNNSSTYDPSLEITLGSWYHLSMTRDNHKLIYYVNGRKLNEASTVLAPGFENNNKLWLGARYGNNAYLKGAIDDVHIYNRTLSESEINLIYSPKTSSCLEYTFSNNTDETYSNYYNLKNIGATFVNDRNANASSAVSLDGVDDFLELNDANSIVSSKISITAWVKINSIPTDGNNFTIVSFGDEIMDHGINVANNYLGLYNGFNGYVYTSPSTNIGVSDTATNITINKWYHLALTADSSVVKFYTNGILVSTFSSNSGPAFGNINKVWVGSRMGTNSFFDGDIDELIICDHVLTPTEIAQMAGLTTNTNIPSQEGIAIFPNPSIHGVFNIQHPETIASYAIFDLLGKSVEYEKGSESSFRLFNKGIYFLTVTKTDGSVITIKILY